MLRQLKKNNFGQSIMEIIAVIFIISLGLVGILSLVNNNLEAQYINKNILVASLLAQEGLEAVRNIRDSNWLIPGIDWKQSLAADGTYAIDYRGRMSLDVSVNDLDDGGARLYLIPSSGFYTHEPAGNQPTNFYRLITVTDYDDYLDVQCAIRWVDRGKRHNYTAETTLYNWR